MTQNKLIFEFGVIPIIVLSLSLILILNIRLTKDDIKIFIPIFTFFSVFKPKNITPNRYNIIVGFSLVGLLFSVITVLLFDSMFPTNILFIKILFFVIISFFLYLIYVIAQRFKLFDKEKKEKKTLIFNNIR